MNSFIGDSVRHFLFRIFGLIISFSITIIISNNLGAEAKGYFSLFFLIIGYFTMIGSIGLPGATVFFSARDPEFNPWHSISLSYLLTILICILYIIICNFYFSNRLSSFMYVIIGTIFILLSNVNNVKQHILISKKKINDYNFTSVVPTFIMLCLFSILYFSGNLNLKNSVILYLLGECLKYCFLRYKLKMFLKKFTLQRNYAIWKKLLLYGLKGHPGRVFWSINHKVDFLFINFLMGTIYVGIYSIAFALTELLTLAASSLSAILVPYITSTDEKHDNLTKSSLNFILYFSLLTGLLLILSSSIIIDTFFIDEYCDAKSIIIFLMPGMILLSLIRVIAAHLSAIGLPQIQSYGAVASLVTTITLDFILIPLYGLAGAAIATSIAYFINFIILFNFFNNHTEIKFRDIIIFDVNLYKLFFSKLLHHRT